MNAPVKPIVTLTSVATSKDILSEIETLKTKVEAMRFDKVIESIAIMKEKLDTNMNNAGKLYCGQNTSYRDGKCEGTEISHHCAAGTRLNDIGTMCVPDMNAVCGTNTKSANDKCEGSPPEDACGPTTQLDPASKKCIATSRACGSGTTYDGTSGKCVIAATPSCQYGTHYDSSSNSCVAGSSPANSEKTTDHLKTANVEKFSSTACEKFRYTLKDGMCLAMKLPNTRIFADIQSAQEVCNSNSACRGFYKMGEGQFELRGGVESCDKSAGHTFIKECDQTPRDFAIPTTTRKECTFKLQDTPWCHDVIDKDTDWGCCAITKEESCAKFSLNSDASLKRKLDEHGTYGGPYDVCFQTQPPPR